MGARTRRRVCAQGLRVAVQMRRRARCCRRVVGAPRVSRVHWLYHGPSARAGGHSAADDRMWTGGVRGLALGEHYSVTTHRETRASVGKRESPAPEFQERGDTLSFGGATAGGKPVTWPEGLPSRLQSRCAPPLRSVARRTADLVESRRSPRLPRPCCAVRRKFLLTPERPNPCTLKRSLRVRTQPSRPLHE